MIRVLHLVSSGGLYGAERVILSLAGQQTAGIEAYVGALDNEHNSHLELIVAAKKAGFKTVIFPSKGRFDFKTIQMIKRFLIGNKIDILHTHNYKSDILGFAAAKLAGKKWIATNHLWHSTDTKLKSYEQLDAFVLKFSNKIVGVSQEIVNDLLNKGLKKDLVVVVHNGINIDQFNKQPSTNDLRQTLGIKENEIVVSIIGRLAIEKGHNIFLQAAQKVIQKHPQVKFLIIGDGPLRKEIQAQVQNLGVSKHVVLTGICKDMPQMYALSDILVNASSMEGLPMTILEAMAAKLPMIVTDVGAVPQVIQDQRNGILLKPGTPDHLAEAILTLINNPQKRQELAKQAYQDVSAKFSDTRMAQEYSQIYEEVLKTS